MPAERHSSGLDLTIDRGAEGSPLSIKLTQSHAARTRDDLKKYETARCDEIFAYKRFVGVTTSRDAAWRALLTCQ